VECVLGQVIARAQGRTLLLLTVLGGLIAGDGTGIASLVGVLLPPTVHAAVATPTSVPYTPPSGKYVDPAKFLTIPALLHTRPARPHPLHAR
jgi:hypothetical protein